MHKISIIIPVYNADKYLSACLESVINQTYQNLEIILINDGSIDSSPKICDDYALKDERIKVIHQSNKGVSVARNTGLKNVTGSYLGFVDSDDIVALNFYEVLMQTLLQHNADIVECGFVEFENEIDLQILEREYRQTEIYNTVSALEMLMKEHLKQILWNKIYKIDVTKEIVFENGRINEDDFWAYQVFGNAKIIVKVFDVLYFYRQHSASIMGKSYAVKRLDGLIALEKRIYFMKVNFPKLENLAIRVFCFGSMDHYQKIFNHSEIDPQNVYRRKILENVKKYNQLSIISKWDWKAIFWFQLFIVAPNIFVKVRSLNEARVKMVQQNRLKE